jgi:replication fork clamp-binding protein CrfC
LGFVNEEDAMPAGRPHEGADLVDRLAGSDEAKKRFKTIMETITGETLVKDAIARLGISETRFYQLRDEVLKAGLSSMEPAKPGRPSSRSAEDEEEIARLRIENSSLRVELHREGVRADVNEVLSLPVEPYKKKEPKRRKRRRRGRLLMAKKKENGAEGPQGGPKQ